MESVQASGQQSSDSSLSPLVKKLKIADAKTSSVALTHIGQETHDIEVFADATHHANHEYVFIGKGQEGQFYYTKLSTLVKRLDLTHEQIETLKSRPHQEVRAYLEHQLFDGEIQKLLQKLKGDPRTYESSLHEILNIMEEFSTTKIDPVKCVEEIFQAIARKGDTDSLFLKFAKSVLNHGFEEFPKFHLENGVRKRLKEGLEAKDPRGAINELSNLLPHIAKVSRNVDEYFGRIIATLEDKQQHAWALVAEARVQRVSLNCQMCLQAAIDPVERQKSIESLVAWMSTLARLKQDPVSILKQLAKSLRPEEVAALLADEAIRRYQQWNALGAATVELKVVYDPHVASRFRDIPCPEQTRFAENVHANRVTLANLQFICAQAPLPATEEAFWRLASSRTDLIVDLTNTKDRKEGFVQRYFPHKEGTSLRKGSLDISCRKKEGNISENKNLKLHSYQVQDSSTSESKPIRRLHYKGWPDQGTIQVSALATLVGCIRRYTPNLQNEAIVLHCKAGVGRTGTVAVAIALEELASKKQLNVHNASESILNLVIEGRKQRGTAFVQTEAQYELLYQYAMHLIKSYDLMERG